MSAINGDKSRFNRERKQRIARRKRNRELLPSAGKLPSAADKASAAKPKAVSA